MSKSHPAVQSSFVQQARCYNLIIFPHKCSFHSFFPPSSQTTEPCVSNLSQRKSKLENTTKPLVCMKGRSSSLLLRISVRSKRAKIDLTADTESRFLKEVLRQNRTKRQVKRSLAGWQTSSSLWQLICIFLTQHCQLGRSVTLTMWIFYTHTHARLPCLTH